MKRVYIDFESYYDSDWTLTKIPAEEYIRGDRFECLGLAAKWDDAPARWYDPEEIPRFVEDLLCEDSIELVAHNMAFDGAILAYRYNYNCPQRYSCTQSMARACIPPIYSVRLADLSELLLPAGQEKIEIDTKGWTADMLAEDAEKAAELAAYALRDVENCAALYDIFAGMSPFDHDRTERDVIDATIRAVTVPRIVLDTNLLRREAVQDTADDLLLQFEPAERDALRTMVRSASKFARALQALGVEVEYKATAKGNRVPAIAKTDPYMKSLLAHPERAVQSLAQLRLESRSVIRHTRAARLLGIASRGYLPIETLYHAAHTGRHAGSGKINPQNLPHGGALRNALCAPAGHRFVVADAAQIEARVLAAVAGERSLSQAFASGEDVYATFGTVIFGRPISKEDTPRERQLAKSGVLGCGYGMGVDRFLAQFAHLEPTRELAEQVVYGYRRTYPAIPRLWREANDWIAYMAAENRRVPLAIEGLWIEPYRIRLPGGRYLNYPRLQGDTYETLERGRTRVKTKIYGAKLVENLIQAMARDITMSVMARLHANVADRAMMQCVLSVHDELVFVVPAEHVEEAKARVYQEMTRPVPYLPDLTLEAEVAVGQRYGECK